MITLAIQRLEFITEILKKENMFSTKKKNFIQEKKRKHDLEQGNKKENTILTEKTRKKSDLDQEKKRRDGLNQ